MTTKHFFVIGCQLLELRFARVVAPYRTELLLSEVTQKNNPRALNTAVYCSFIHIVKALIPSTFNYTQILDSPLNVFLALKFIL